jgi:hypothetical protein
MRGEKKKVYLEGARLNRNEMAGVRLAGVYLMIGFLL